MRTVGEPGVHGDSVLGMQGMGVRTPRAADVAEATIGLAKDAHMPKEGMLTIGLLSIMVPADVPHIVLLVGNTFRLLGAKPNGHISIAPETTRCINTYTLTAWLISSLERDEKFAASDLGPY